MRQVEHDSPSEIVRLNEVSRRFKDGTGGRVALDAVSLSVSRGEIFGVVGRSGAGKSTLVRTINLLERPDAGQVIIAGEDITTLGQPQLRVVRRRIGMIFQHFNLLHNRTVRGNVALPLQLEGHRHGEVAARVDALLHQLGMSAHADKYPAQLSGGQKQRVGIARALACAPQILLCDEATSALDPETTEDILALLDRLNRELGLTIVLITHEMDVVRRICDRVAVMSQGRVVEAGPVSEVFLHPRSPEAHALLREAVPPAAAIPDAVRARVVFIGDDAFHPVLSSIARETGVDFAILSGRVGRLRREAYGEMEIAFFGAHARAGMDALRRAGVVVEEIA
ncbi:MULTISPECIES: ATP-binding cassette domain-containing protein [unclassified Pseudoxanthomonas]|uniref:methionine ABC transporter ATP-binding protein n=1 Tax=unclassified Pseudoxanthomonas TaxID=2645906 RepID=UPI003077DF2F